MFWTWQCFILGFLVFSLLVHSVYKNPKSNYHPLFPAIFPDLEMLQFWSAPYIWQVWKLYLYFGHARNVGQYLYLSVLVNSESVLLLAFVKYMLYRHSTENCIFSYFVEAKNPYFETQIGSKFSYICIFILSKKQHNWFYKIFHNSGTVGRRKLTNPSLNSTLNALSIGVQYKLLSRWTDFGLKCLWKSKENFNPE